MNTDKEEGVKTTRNIKDVIGTWPQNLGGRRSILVGDKTTLESDKLDRAEGEVFGRGRDRLSLPVCRAGEGSGGVFSIFAIVAMLISAGGFVCNPVAVEDHSTVKAPIIIMLD